MNKHKIRFSIGLYSWNGQLTNGTPTNGTYKKYEGKNAVNCFFRFDRNDGTTFEQEITRAGGETILLESENFNDGIMYLSFTTVPLVNSNKPAVVGVSYVRVRKDLGGYSPVWEGENIKAENEHNLTIGYPIQQSEIFYIDVLLRTTYIVIDEETYQPLPPFSIMPNPPIEKPEDTKEPDPVDPPMEDYTYRRMYYLTPYQYMKFVEYRLDSSFDKNDLSKYINQIFTIPLKIDKGSQIENIVLGNYKTNRKGYVLEDREIKYNLGTIRVNKTYENTLDYYNVKCKLFVPFIQSHIDIQPEIIMGYHLDIEYIIDIINGQASINIYNYDRVLIQTATINLATQTPLFWHDNKVNVNLAPQYVLNEITKPFLHIEYPLIKDEKRFLTTKTGKLKDCKGFNQVLEIDLKSQALADEKARIKSILNSGFYIN